MVLEGQGSWKDGIAGRRYVRQCTEVLTYLLHVLILVQVIPPPT